MPDVTYTTEIAATPEQVWEYVENFDNWAHLMIGFQKLEVVDDRQSLWTLRGDVGILSRAVDLKVDITEWVPRERVDFVVTGVTERLEGSGSFVLDRVGATSVIADPAAADPGPPAAAQRTEPTRPTGLWHRIRLAYGRFVLRRLRPRPRTAAGTPVAVDAEVPPATPSLRSVTDVPPAVAESSRLTFELEVRPGGPMAPMLDLLMSPMLEPAAEDLALGIRRALEA